jgi:hypothetical protein
VRVEAGLREAEKEGEREGEREREREREREGERLGHLDDGSLVIGFSFEGCQGGVAMHLQQGRGAWLAQ